MPGHVIFFSVVLGAAAMRVGGKVTVLSGDLLRFVHTIADARVVPSVAPGQTKASPPGAGAEFANGSAGSTGRMQISRSDSPATVAKVSSPTHRVAGQLLDHLVHAPAPGRQRDLPDPLLESSGFLVPVPAQSSRCDGIAPHLRNRS